MSKQDKKTEVIAYIDFGSRKIQAGRDIVKRVIDSVSDDVIFHYKICPPVDGDEKSYFAAKAGLAAEKQGHFDEMRDRLFASNEEYTEELMLAIAQEMQLDIEMFRTDFYSDTLDFVLQKHWEEARKAGVYLIPSITINNSIYHGAWDEQALLEAIKKSKAQPIKSAIDNFFKWGASAAFALLLATIAALIFANAGFHETYEHWRHTDFGFVFGQGVFQLPVEMWINDALMAIFFLLIGLEIKREILYGELSDLKRAAMPVIGAIGGMVIPALIYVVINIGGDGIHGWGVPMATDIAFTLGLMALLGRRVPLSLKVFVSALAVADDLGAILVIAIFYGHGFHMDAFIAAMLTVGVMAFLNYRRVYSISLYVILGIVLWFFIHESGLHATLAGVLTAALIPSRRSGDLEGVSTQVAMVFDHEIAHAKDTGNYEGIRHGSLRLVQNAVERLREPAYYLEHSLEKWVNYLILPLFAFFNTGILLAGTRLNVLEPINLGIIIALCIGKPVGIVGACWLASKSGIARISSEISWPQLWGGGCLAGVGFTMSIVVAGAAFNGPVLDAAKMSILIASTIAAVMGITILYKSKEL
ncbi:MAG: Na+/H+ antiporter NhaA [Pseudomonadota bacterium]